MGTIRREKKVSLFQSTYGESGIEKIVYSVSDLVSVIGQCFKQISKEIVMRHPFAYGCELKRNQVVIIDRK